MAFPAETVSLGIAWASKKLFATYKLPGSPLLAWNGAAWATNTPANLVLGAVTATADAEGDVSFQPVAELLDQYASQVWPQAGANPAVGDITTPPAGVSIPLAQGGITSALSSQASVNSIGTTLAGIASGATVVNANNASGEALYTATSGSVLKSDLDNLQTSVASGVFTTAALANAPSGGSGGYSGTAQGNGGGANTIQLAAGASSAQNYVGQQIVIFPAAFEIEPNVVVSYNGATKVCTCANNWVNAVTNTTPYAFPGLFGRVLVAAGGIASPQNFNNTGQTTPFPIIPPFGQTIAYSAGATSSTFTEATLNATIDYPFTWTFTYAGLDCSAWSQFTWTVKQNASDLDSAAIVAIKKTNPPSGTDGLITLNGAPYAIHSDGSLTITTSTNAIGQPSTQVAVTLNAAGMALASSFGGIWGTTVYFATVKQPQIDGGRFEANYGAWDTLVQT